MIRGLFLIGFSATIALLAGLRRARKARSAPMAEDLRDILPEAIAWIEEMRDRYREGARPLDEAERGVMAPFFPPEILDGVRVRTLASLENPAFLEDFGLAPGGGLLFDVTTASALAAVDTVLAVESRVEMGTENWSEVLFHELVHLVQYRELGTRVFVASYVESMEEVGFKYSEIAHEAQALDLERRFREDPETPFSVVAEVRERFVL